MGTSFGVGDLNVYVNNAKRDNLDQVLRLLNQTIRNPRLDAASIGKARQDEAFAAQVGERSPVLLARNTLHRRLWQLPESHPLYDATSAERAASSKSVPDGEVAKIYQELWSPGNMVLVVVGDFVPDTVHRLVRDVFGDWNKPDPARSLLMRRTRRRAPSISRSPSAVRRKHR